MGGRWAKVWLSAPLEGSRALKWREGCRDGMEVGQQLIALQCSAPCGCNVIKEQCHR